MNGSGPQFASVIPGFPLYEHKPIPGVTQPGTAQWLNPNTFVSAVDPSTGACYGGDSPKTCQFGNLGRNALRGPDFAWSDFYLTKWFRITERVKYASTRDLRIGTEKPSVERFKVLVLALLARKRAIRTSALSSGQKRGLQADAHTGNGYKRSRRTLHLADREVDKSLTRAFVGNSRERQK